MTKVKNEVAVAGQFNKSDVPDMLETINKQIAAIKNPAKSKQSTAGKNLLDFGKLENINDLSTLIMARSSVFGRAKAYSEEVIKMKDKGVVIEEAPEFNIAECSAEDWINDIDARYNKVNHAALLAKLEKGRDFLKKHISKEDQFQQDAMEFKELFMIK